MKTGRMARFLSILLPVCLSLSVVRPAAAGPEFEEWDPLPRIEDIVFSAQSVGFVSSDRRYFLLDRTSHVFLQTDASSFSKEFDAHPAPKPSENFRDPKGESFTRLRASNGLVLKEKSAYCGEGASDYHRLWSDEMPLPDHVDPCHEVLVIEVVGDELWLGTAGGGGGGKYPGEGIVIQSLDGSEKIGRISHDDGLTGDLIRVIRIDPVDRNVWVATHLGIDEMDAARRVVYSGFFYEDFDPASGQPTVYLSPSPRPNNPLAVVSRELKVEKPMDFYRAVKRIPKEVRESFSLYTFYMESFPNPFSPKGLSPRKPFAPEEAHVLIPYFIRSARSTDTRARQLALKGLCMFNDQRALKFFLDLERNAASDRIGRSIAGPCLDKFMKAGIGSEEMTASRIRLTLDRLREALREIKSSSTDANAVYRIARSVPERALTLERMGSIEGLELIDDYFRESGGSDRDATLYEAVLESRIAHQDEIREGILSGLKKFKGLPVSRGCRYFDMRYRKGEIRYGARYAEGVLIGLGHAMKGGQWLEDYTIEACTEAFKSQIRNEKVRESFHAEILPGFPDALRPIAERLERRSSLPFEEAWRGGPDLVISFFSPRFVRVRGGQVIPLRDIVANLGDEPSKPVLVRYYLSEDRMLDPKTDWLVGESEIASLGPGSETGVRKQTFTLPNDLPPGTYHVRICVDANDTQVELNEINNCPEFVEGLSIEAIIPPRR